MYLITLLIADMSEGGGEGRCGAGWCAAGLEEEPTGGEGKGWDGRVGVWWRGMQGAWKGSGGKESGACAGGNLQGLDKRMACLPLPLYLPPSPSHSLLSSPSPSSSPCQSPSPSPSSPPPPPPSASASPSPCRVRYSWVSSDAGIRKQHNFYLILIYAEESISYLFC